MTTREQAANVAARLLQVATHQADDTAFVVSGGASMTFGEYERATEAFAASLQSRGVGVGDRVVVFVPMSIELYVVLAAVLRIGAVVVFIDPWIGREGIAAAARLTEPTAFVGVPKAHLLRAVSRDLRKVRVAVSVGGSAIVAGISGSRRYDALVRAGRGIAAPIVEVEPGAHALITFTTGSTGTPKGADRTHALLNAQTTVLGRHVTLEPGDVHYTNLPIVALHNVAEGVTTAMAPARVAQNASPDGAALLEHVRATAPTVLTLSPGPLAALLDAARAAHVALPGVQRIFTGGGPVLPSLVDGIDQVFPNATCSALYGSTECEPISHIDAGELVALRGVVRAHGGIPVGTEVDETTVRLVRPIDGPPPAGMVADLSAWQVEDGEPGEVIVAGQHVNRGYYRNADATGENKIIEPDGTLWHRTGDVARRGADGSLWLLGRVGSEVVVGERTIYPLELTTALEDLPTVGRVALAHDAARQPVLVVGTTGHPEALAAAHNKLAELGLADAITVRGVSAIPLDQRHAAKVDTAALARLLA